MRKQTEHLEQVHLFRLIEIASAKIPALALLFAIPNGGKRSKITAANMKREGVRSGVPDCFLPVPSNGYTGMFLEMKAKGRTLSDNQKAWKQILEFKGYKHCTCYSAEEALQELKDYLDGKNI